MQWKIFGRVFYLSKTILCLLGLAIGLVLVAGGYFLLPQESVISTEEEFGKTAMVIETEGAFSGEETTAPPTTEPAFWRIYIVGAVKEPGLYTLKEGALVYDAVLAAGGLLPEADRETINLVQELAPNFMVRILTERQRIAQGRQSSLILIKNNEEVSGQQLESQSAATGLDKKGKININSATKEELMQLSGIGQSRAESIIAYREENGPFQSIEDIMLVSGIKEGAFAKIKDYITTT